MSNNEEQMDRNEPDYQRWLGERSCTEYMHYTRSGTIRSRDSAKVAFMFTKKIKLLLCDSEMAIYLITEDGEVYHWYDESSSEPILKYYTQLIDLRNARFIQTATGSKSTFLALTEDNKLYYFRTEDNDGLFGWMRQINIKNKITCIACGKAFFVIVTNDHKVYSWGKNNYGQLGISTCTEEFIEEPCEIKFIGSKIVKITCGLTHTLALTITGKVFVWGRNVYGELGLNNREIISSPVMIDIFDTKKVLDVAAMKNMSCAICEDGLTYIWGACFDQQIRKPVACEYTTLFDMCNALCARPPTTVKCFGSEKSIILKELGDMFNNPLMSDLTIKVEERSIYVHKAILQIRSSFFKTMFPSKLFKENTLKLCQFPYATYYAYFKYLYTGEIELSLEDKFEFLKLADMYKETKLEEFIFRSIKTEITVANVIPVYNMARKLNKQMLGEYCLEFFAKNMTDVIKTDNFAELDEDMKEIFRAKAPEAFITEFHA